MSVETLKQDLEQVIASIPQGPLTTAVDLAGFICNNLVPFVENIVDELVEQDECIGALVNESEDILHEENAEVFAGIIASGKVLIGELRVRIGNDKRVLGLIREYEILAAKGARILTEIVIPDDDADDAIESTVESATTEAVAPGAASGGDGQHE
jgi:hypothetical protein